MFALFKNEARKCEIICEIKKLREKCRLFLERFSHYAGSLEKMIFVEVKEKMKEYQASW